MPVQARWCLRTLGACAEQMPQRRCLGFAIRWETLRTLRENKTRANLKFNLVMEKLSVSDCRPVAYWRRVASRMRADGTGALIYR